MIGGIKLALDEYNKAHPDCKVKLKDFDSQGDPEKATPLATQIVHDDAIIGLVGPAFSGESLATGKTFNEAGLAIDLAVGDQPDDHPAGWTTFHRVLGNDATRAPPPRSTSRTPSKAKKVFVVDDASEYGKGLADIVKTASARPGRPAPTPSSRSRPTSRPTVTKVKASGADALFYGGYYPEAGLLVKQLRQAGWKGTVHVG